MVQPWTQTPGFAAEVSSKVEKTLCENEILKLFACFLYTFVIVVLSNAYKKQANIDQISFSLGFWVYYVNAFLLKS